jgi:hypothetical protein
MGLGAFGWGAARDWFGTRTVVLAGAALLGLALPPRAVRIVPPPIDGRGLWVGFVVPAVGKANGRDGKLLGPGLSSVAMTTPTEIAPHVVGATEFMSSYVTLRAKEFPRCVRRFFVADCRIFTGEKAQC